MARRELIERTHRSISRLARSFQQLMREQLSCGPVTVQQCHTLAALVGGPRTMKSLAAEVGLHQSTLTRVVEKLEHQELLRRERGGEDQRRVQVALTDAGRRTHALLDAESERIVGTLLDRVSKNEQAAVVKGLETLARVVDPNSAAFRDVLCQCCPGDEK
jgi:DNA-binding MarR family transcriptional regulator